MAGLTEAAHVRHSVRVPEDVGAVRRAVSSLCADLRDVREGEAELVATELATNLVRHAKDGGYVLIRGVGEGIELLAVDAGPGMSPAGPSSTPAGPARRVPSGAEGLHVGLASVQRLAESFDCYTHRSGTVVMARLGVPATDPRIPWRWGAVNIPMGGDGPSGDGWAVVPDRRLCALVVDGLGHGPAAAAAALAALSTFDAHAGDDPADFARRAHQAMRSTRGGVIGLGVIDPDRDAVRFLGVGNVASQVLIKRGRSRLIGRDGVLGTEQAPPASHLDTGPWEPGATLVLSSDGVRAQWELSDYPGLLHHDPTVIAAVLHRDYGEEGDDATVLVVRDMRGSS
ncbi:MAG TPA: SpoIIE family protein phosphatase [Actinopolymorphaceae bacterium]|nr:SpoIIE family protein phosphatase [Actinopolymorphaceae bacterium]